ncbi:hypothetical protein [Rhodovulum sulfidophilum]|nr:hypothetical protein [Rhodovulum sulfidophilum]MBL3566406.1 hypothetical protein [Rhodovulum sulfidophilum]MBL3572693.1 hypothetical protein [Rhodovulum sulfidophilum]MCE8430554.1 hypothetical protein [Rhodovulum sulfidophilum]MCF4117197.1 hypothetical protein [Rhodovulum sulfidophilum]
MASAFSTPQSSRPAAPQEPARDASASRPAPRPTPADGYTFRDWASI